MGKSELKKTLEDKKAAKEALFKVCWPGEKMNKPLVILFEPESGHEVLFKLLEGCLVLNANFIVVSNKEPEDFIRHPAGKITWVSTEDGRNLPKIDEYLKAADIAVILEDHSESLESIMVNGTVLIGHEKSVFLQNYHPNDETGNAFTYATINPWDVFTAMVRAMETFRFPYDWQNIIRGILKSARSEE